MAAIANRWTGNGLADGTALTSGNVNQTGNGSTVARGASGSPTFVTQGDGFRYYASTATDIARIDATLASASKGLLVQCVSTFDALPSGIASVLTFRGATTNPAFLNFNTSRQYELADASGTLIASRTPAVEFGDRVLVDMVVTLNPAPTTSNGRMFFRLRNLTNAGWNGGAAFFYDTGYTRNVGVDDLTAVRFGKNNTFTIAATGSTLELLGWQAVTVSTGDTNSSAAAAYFADAPTTPPPAIHYPMRRWNGTAYVPLRPFRWSGTGYVPLDMI